MKRTACLLRRATWVLVCLFVFMAYPSTALGGLKTTGRLTFTIDGRYSSSQTKEFEIASLSRLNLTATFFPGEDDATRAVVDINGSTPRSVAKAGDPLIAVPENLRAGSSYLESTMPLWTGGPQWLFRLGTQSIRWSPLMSRVSSRTGLTVSNVNIGPVHTRWLYLWASPNQGVTTGVQASYRLGTSLIDMTVIGMDSKIQAALETNASLFAHRVNVGMGASVSQHGIGQTMLNVSFAATPDLQVSVSRHGIVGVDPFSAHPPQLMTQHALQAQADYWGNSFQWMISRMDQSAYPAILAQEFSVHRGIHIGRLPVSVGYDLKWDSMMGQQHRMTTSTRLDLAMFKGINVRADLSWGDSSNELSWRANATYNVSKGPSFTVTYDKNTGPSFTANLGINF